MSDGVVSSGNVVFLVTFLIRIEETAYGFGRTSRWTVTDGVLADHFAVRTLVSGQHRTGHSIVFAPELVAQIELRLLAVPLAKRAMLRLYLVLHH